MWKRSYARFRSKKFKIFTGLILSLAAQLWWFPEVSAILELSSLVFEGSNGQTFQLLGKSRKLHIAILGSLVRSVSMHHPGGSDQAFVVGGFDLDGSFSVFLGHFLIIRFVGGFCLLQILCGFFLTLPFNWFVAFLWFGSSVVESFWSSRLVLFFFLEPEWDIGDIISESWILVVILFPSLWNWLLLNV